MHAHRLAAAAVMAAVLSASLASGIAAGTAWLGPAVVSGWKNGPVTIPNSSGQTDIASLALPAGRWAVWAKLFVANATTGRAVVGCVLAGPGSQLGQQGVVEVGSASGMDAPSVQPFALSAYLTFGAGGGSADVACAADVDQGVPQLSASWIKIMAMRLGTIRSVNMINGSTTTAGSGKPAVTIGVRPYPITLPKGTSVTVGKLWLGAGAWWVRTTFTLWEDGLSGNANCKLKIGTQTRDSTFIAAAESTVNAVMDTAAYLGSGRWVKVVCTGGTNATPYGPQSASDVAITAVQLGTLVTWTDSGGQTYGSGKPRVTALSTDPAYTLPNQQWTTVAGVGLDAGAWMILAKADLSSGQPAACHLVAEDDYDRSEVGTWGYLTLPLAVMHSFGAAGQSSVLCRPSLSGTSTVSMIRIAAFKLGSLTNVAL